MPIRNKTANTVARAFESGVLANSVLIPKTVLSDNGPEFKSKLFHGMLNKYDISQELSIPYRPQSNGMVERLNRTICGRLAAVVDGDYRHWDTFLPKVMVQYNRTVHGETDRTPVSYYTEIVEEPVIARRFDVRRPPGENFEPYKVGDLVLCKIQFYEERHKLARRYEVPYKIVDCLSNVSYKVIDMRNKKRRKLVHVTQIKRYFGGFVPSREFRRSHKSKLVELEREIKFPKTFEPAYVTPTEMAKIRASFREPSVVVTPRSEFGGSSNKTVSSERSPESPPAMETNINEDLLNVNRERPVRFASTPDRSIVPPITIVESREGEISAVVEEGESFSFKGFEPPITEVSVVAEKEENFSFEGFEPPILDTEPSSLRAQEIF